MTLTVNKNYIDMDLAELHTKGLRLVSCDTCVDIYIIIIIIITKKFSNTKD